MISRQLIRGITRCHSHLLSEVPISCAIRYSQCTTALQSACFCSNAFVSNVMEDSSTIPNTKVHNRNKNRQFQNARTVKPSSQKDFYIAQSDPDTFGNLQGSRVREPETKDEGDVEEEKFLEEGPTKGQRLTTKQYATMIKEFFKNKKVADAIDVLETRMLKIDRVKPENYIYNLIIGECGRLGYTKKAFNLYNQMKKRDLKVTGATYTGLFNACANSPWPKDGLKQVKHLRELIIEKGHELNASNYHAMIKAFGRCSDLSTAFSLVDEMSDKELDISDRTFNILFQACISDKEAGFRHALLVWRKMKNNGVKPDIYTYNLLLRSIRDCGLGDLDSAHNVIHQILQESQNRVHARRTRAKPALEEGDRKPIIALESMDKESSAEHCLINDETVTTDSKPSHVTDIAIQIPENRPNLLAPKPHLGNIIALTEITKPEDRLLLIGGCSGFLEQMKRDGVKPDIKTFTQLLDNIPSTKAAELALLSALKKEGIITDIDFYNMLIKKRSMRFDYVGAHEVLTLIRKAKVHPDIVTFGVLALACRTQEEAEHLISDMENAGFRMNAEILGAMLKTGCVTWNFNYVLSIMEVMIKEQIRPNEEFLQHLENFLKNCQRKRKHKDTNLPGIPNGVNSSYFRNGFKKFTSRYSSWLKEVVPEKVGHPWEQFQKKVETKTAEVN